MSPELDRQLDAAHASVLERLAPGTASRRLAWSQGETRVLELGDGRPLVLVHGAFDNAALWAPILGALARHHRVLAVDLPGHGLADPFDYEPADLVESPRRSSATSWTGSGSTASTSSAARSEGS